MKRKVKIKVIKMVQVKQYEPVTIEVEEEGFIEFEDEQDLEEKRLEMYKGVTRAVKTYMDNEIRKWGTK